MSEVLARARSSWEFGLLSCRPGVIARKRAMQPCRSRLTAIGSRAGRLTACGRHRHVYIPHAEVLRLLFLLACLMSLSRRPTTVLMPSLARFCMPSLVG